MVPGKETQVSNLDKAHEHIQTALDKMNSITPYEALTNAVIAATYTNLAVLDYIRERDSQPYNEQMRLIELGIELGKKEHNDNLNSANNPVRDVEGRDSQS